MIRITAAFSDMHWGGPDHMPRVRQSILNAIVDAVAEIAQRGEVEVQPVSNGDLCVGSGIWRSQIWQQIMPDAAWQAWGVAYIWAQWHRRLAQVCEVKRAKVVKGNHDRDAAGGCLASAASFDLNTLGVPATFVGTETTVNLAPDGAEPSSCLFEHGYGMSAYYPMSYSLLRNTEKKMLTYTAMDATVTRGCFGHSHWLFTGYALTPFHHLDCLGGMQRNDRAQIGRGVRSSGAILYVHDGERLDVVEIEPAREALIADLRDGHLEGHNRHEIADVMDEVMRWMEVHGYIEPDVIAKAAV